MYLFRTYVRNNLVSTPTVWDPGVLVATSQASHAGAAAHDAGCKSLPYAVTLLNFEVTTPTTPSKGLTRI